MSNAAPHRSGDEGGDVAAHPRSERGATEALHDAGRPSGGSPGPGAPRRGRVLVGLQVPGGERAAFRRFLRELKYEYADESRNPAYRFFLR